MTIHTINCTIVNAREHNENAVRYDFDLLPWADPYIAQLVDNLQRSSEGRLRSRFERSSRGSEIQD